MKMSRRQLDELLRLITKLVLNEYSSMTSSQADAADEPSADSSVKPMDAMTSAEKSKMKRDQDLKNKDELDKAKQQQVTNKEKATSYKSQYDHWKRFEKQGDDKAVKGWQKKVATHSAIAENIRKMRS